MSGKRFLASFCLPFFLMLLAGATVSAEESLTTEFSYGAVVSKTDSTMVVNEYDYEKDEDVQVSYDITDKTEFQNVNSLAEIAAGDTVDVIYQIENGIRKCLHVSVEKPENESDLEPDDLEPVHPEPQNSPQNEVHQP